MSKRQPMPDLVVVIPGILGSVLEHDGKEVWGVSAGGVIRNLLRLGQPIKDLKLPAGIGDHAPDDGVIASRLMPSAVMVPGFWSIVDGYTEQLNYLETKFELARSSAGAPGNFLPFAYDWRLSNRLNAQRLADTVVPSLERWRKAGHADAKLIFICHSMGGLIARWFIEVLGGNELTKALVTLGTPYRGSINALQNIANGFAPGIGPIRLKLDDVLRSFPSVYQLLPAYACLEVDGQGLQKLTSVDVPNAEASRVFDAMEFHRQMSEAAARGETYSIHALKGIVQPTAQSARIEASSVVPIASYDGKDAAGDGTVPRFSAHPPEWKSEDRSVYFGQQHASLQLDAGGLLQLFGILTAQSVTPMSPSAMIGVEAPDSILFGESLEVVAKSTNGDSTLPLRVVVFDEAGEPAGTKLMTPSGDGDYHAMIDGLAPGCHKVTVESAVAQRSVDPVSKPTLVWSETLGEV